MRWSYRKCVAIKLFAIQMLTCRILRREIHTRLQVVNRIREMQSSLAITLLFKEEIAMLTLDYSQ